MGVWLLWPEPGYLALDQPSAAGDGRQSPGAVGQSDGLVAAAQASVAISAKRQLAGEAIVVQARLKQRLRQVAKTMPEIAVPGEPPVDARAKGNTPAAPLQTVQPETAAGAGHARAALTEINPPAEPAAPDRPPDTAMVARAGPAEEATPFAALGSDEVPGEAAPADSIPTAAVIGRAAAVDRVPSGTAPDVMGIEPAAAPAKREPSAEPRDGRTVALLEVPADILAPQPEQRRTPTWLRNAVTAAVDARPAVAVVIDDLGLNRRGTAALNRLRAPLTLAFLPYATDLDEQTRAAGAAGHELMVHVPMEPRSQQEWPGPNALTSQLGPAELVSRLRSHLRSFRGFVGVNNHMGSLLTTDAARMAILMAELRQRGLLFLDSRTTPDSVAARVAARTQVPFAERDVFIDNELDLPSVLRALAHAEHIARRQGHAVAMGHPHDVTIEALKRWLPGLDARGIALVPISAIVARQSCASGLILVGDACARYAVAESAVR